MLNDAVIQLFPSEVDKSVITVTKWHFGEISVSTVLWANSYLFNFPAKSTSYFPPWSFTPLCSDSVTHRWALPLSLRYLDIALDGCDVPLLTTLGAEVFWALLSIKTNPLCVQIWSDVLVLLLGGHLLSAFVLSLHRRDFKAALEIQIISLCSWWLKTISFPCI